VQISRVKAGGIIKLGAKLLGGVNRVYWSCTATVSSRQLSSTKQTHAADPEAVAQHKASHTQLRFE
jgi:hypothetical protein